LVCDDQALDTERRVLRDLDLFKTELFRKEATQTVAGLGSFSSAKPVGTKERKSTSLVLPVVVTSKRTTNWSFHAPKGFGGIASKYAGWVLRAPMHLSVTEVKTPSKRSLEILQSIVWGTDGTRYVTPEAAQDIERLRSARYFEASVGQQVAGMYAIVPMTLHAGGQTIASYYRSLLVVDPALGNAGVGRALSAAARETIFDVTQGPSFIYGYIDSLNTRSLSVARRNGYERLFDLVPTAVGWFRPKDDARVCVATRADAPELAEKLRAYWQGHVHGDFDEAQVEGEYVVLRERGAIVAGAQMSRKVLDIVAMDGASGALLMRASPLLSRLSQSFAVHKRSMLWWGHYFADQPAALATLLQAMQARTVSASGLSYLDPRSERMRTLRQKAFGPHAALLPGGPRLHVMAALKHLDDAPLRTLPFLASPLTSA
jgi:hypothetical protein